MDLVARPTDPGGTARVRRALDRTFAVIGHSHILFSTVMGLPRGHMGVSYALPSSDQRGPYDMGQKWCYYAIHCDRRSPTSRAKEDVIVFMANGVAVYFSVQFSSNSALTRNKVLIWDRVEARLCGLCLQL